MTTVDNTSTQQVLSEIGMADRWTEYANFIKQGGTELKTASEYKKFQVVAVPWGNGPFDSLFREVRDLLGEFDGQCADPIDRLDYSVVGGLPSLIPSIALFPIYLLEERRQHWAAVQFATQKRIALILPLATAEYLEKKFSGTDKDLRKKKLIPLASFSALIKRLHDASSNEVKFYHFGNSHAAVPILIRALELERRQYILNELTDFHDVPGTSAAWLSHMRGSMSGPAGAAL